MRGNQIIHFSRLSSLSCIVSCLLFCGSEAIAESAKAYFGGPNILKLDWATRALESIDIDGDERKDLAVINNDTTRIDLLIQSNAMDLQSNAKLALDTDRWKPVFEDAHYRKESISVGFPIFDLGAGDFNGDGLVDFAYTAREYALTVRFQGEGLDFSEFIVFEGFEALGWVETIEVVDLQGDGSREIVVLSENGFRIFDGFETNEVVEPELFRLTGENPFNLIVTDVTGDALLDVLYVSSSGKQALVLREQLKDGGFGPERRFILDRSVRSIRILPDADSESVQFCAVDSRSGGLEFFSIEAETIRDEQSLAVSNGQPMIYPMFDSGRGAASYTNGDLNRDGITDLIVSNPSAAEMYAFFGEVSGFGQPMSFPSFVGVSSLTEGRFYEDGFSGLIAVSPEEKLVGFSEMAVNGRLTFPRGILSFVSDPLVAVSSDLDTNGLDELLLVVEEEGDYFILVCGPVDRSDRHSDWTVISKTELEGVRRKPTGVRELAVFPDKESGFLIFVAREAPLFLRSDSEDSLKLVEVGTDSALRSGLLKGLKGAEVSVFDLDENGQNELVVGRKGFARALRFDGTELVLVDQLNARRDDDLIEAVIPITNGTRKQVLFYVRSSNEFQLLEKDDAGVFRYQASIEVGPIDLIEWFHLGTEHSVGPVVLAGENRFWTLPMIGSQYLRKKKGSYETSIEDVFFSDVSSGDFDGDGVAEVIGIDGTNHVTELISWQKNSEWKGFSFWAIFEQNMHFQGRTGAASEPREVVVDDFNGDGRLDFSFLIHDRILFYPQE